MRAQRPFYLCRVKIIECDSIAKQAQQHRCEDAANKPNAHAVIAFICFVSFDTPRFMQYRSTEIFHFILAPDDVQFPATEAGVNRRNHIITLVITTTSKFQAN